MKTRAERARRRAACGARAEELAAEQVERLGMRILGRNVRVGSLEIDILAADGRALVVIEVRSRGRGSWQRPFDSVDRTKQRRLTRAAALLWTRGFAQRLGLERVRFDVVSVSPGSGGGVRLEYLRAAFCA